MESSRYLVIDVSGGPSAARYPVSYRKREPLDGWSHADRTRRIVLRRVEPGSFTMGCERRPGNPSLIGFLRFRPEFEYVGKNVGDPNLLIFFTDGCGSAPERAPGYSRHVAADVRRRAALRLGHGRAVRAQPVNRGWSVGRLNDLQIRQPTHL